MYAYAERRLDAASFPPAFAFAPDNFPAACGARRGARVGAGLCLLGFVAVVDPPRAAAEAAVRRVRGAGARVLMLTGDHPTTAATIARWTSVLSGGGDDRRRGRRRGSRPNRDDRALELGDVALADRDAPPAAAPSRSARPTAPSSRADMSVRVVMLDGAARARITVASRATGARQGRRASRPSSARARDAAARARGRRRRPRSRSTTTTRRSPAPGSATARAHLVVEGGAPEQREHASGQDLHADDSPGRGVSGDAAAEREQRWDALLAPRGGSSSRASRRGRSSRSWRSCGSATHAPSWSATRRPTRPP